MAPKQIWYGLGVIAAGVILALTLSSCTASCGGKRIQGLKEEAAKAEGAAQAHKEGAEKTDAQGEEQGKKVAAAEQDVESARKRLQELRRPRAAATTLAQPVTPAPGPVLPELPPVPEVPDNRDAVIAQQDVLIQAQDNEIKALKAEKLLLISSRDQWKAAFESENQRAIKLQMALKAAEGVAEANLMKGRIQGFLVGAATGGLGGVALAR